MPGHRLPQAVVGSVLAPSNGPKFKVEAGGNDRTEVLTSANMLCLGLAPRGPRSTWSEPVRFLRPRTGGEDVIAVSQPTNTPGRL